MAQETHSRTTYFVVYVVLLLLLAATIALSFVPIGRHFNNAIAIAIGFIKAVLIILIFMHVKHEPWLTWFFAAAGFIWLGIMIALFSTDYLTRNHPAGMSPKGEPVYITPSVANGPSAP